MTSFIRISFSGTVNLKQIEEKTTLGGLGACRCAFCLLADVLLAKRENNQATAENYQLKLLTRVYSSMSTSKSKNRKASSTENLIQLTHSELENMIQGVVANAIKSLEAEIKA